MSADLFAEFNTPPQATQHPKNENLPGTQVQSQDALVSLEKTHSAQHEVKPKSRLIREANEVQQIVAGDDDDDDGWGDFEVAESAPPRHTTPGLPEASNVLFDVDDFEFQDANGLEDADGDEFGDFELPVSQSTHPSKPPRQPSHPSPTADLPDLLDLNTVPGADQEANILQPGTENEAEALRDQTSAPTHLPAGSRCTRRRDWPSSFNTAAKAVTQEAQASAWPNTTSLASKPLPLDLEEQEWGAWDDVDSSVGGNNEETTAGNEVSDGWDWVAPLDSKSLSIQEASFSQPPPTNIPPPSTILSIFPDVLNCGDGFFKSLTGLSSATTLKVLETSKSLHFLESYILLGTTAARVMAGRKHRWQRDKILAKSMSISASGSKGMKLGGVDKTQATRENREAADVVAVWGQHVGRLRAAVATTNTRHKTSLRVPELSERLQIRVEELSPTARAACIICGLKRQERVVKVDFQVEDSFGEWWVEHWGHRSCKNFWLEHEHRLRQR
ncbi:hypothetical protein CDD82_7517 [Ophiocordyceps australis]|uniref:PARP-type domain-containing protein n=1 Tax=Ophiocordyceps australis TaxID=1399860 RepID=A0A2C5YQH4_9HYPO|nr:hypothetical protein CDD82_7517 [Ophiocordyceps australis]